jgi:hypothetical protein
MLPLVQRTGWQLELGQCQDLDRDSFFCRPRAGWARDDDSLEDRRDGSGLARRLESQIRDEIPALYRWCRISHGGAQSGS